ncbi:MAG TPA: hypothetical protein VF875_03820 [Anaeromyxobacter sp.]
MRSHQLALVRLPAPDPGPEDPTSGRPDLSELALVGALFGMSLVPVVGELVHPGAWSAGVVGFAALAGLLSGRELWSQLRARRARNRS